MRQSSTVSSWMDGIVKLKAGSDRTIARVTTRNDVELHLQLTYSDYNKSPHVGGTCEGRVEPSTLRKSAMASSY